MLKANLIKKSLLSALLISTAIACEEVPSVSILAETEDFVQAASEVNNKIDILWVVDSSGSMHDSQVAMTSNFQAFINDMEAKSYDFQIAIITTDAYMGGARELYKVSPNGTTIFTPNTPDFKAQFISTAMVGTRGGANERALQSMETSLANASNKTHEFPRKDAFFSVVILSDEDESSGGAYLGKNHYLGVLDALDIGSSIQGQQNYSVNAIVRLPTNAGCTSGVNGVKYMEMVEATNGIVADICGDFGASLAEITGSIVQLSTQFYLERQPIVETIKVNVNGASIPNNNENGWSYKADSNSILFHGTAVPAQGASILIDFDPVTLIN